MTIISIDEVSIILKTTENFAPIIKKKITFFTLTYHETVRLNIFNTTLDDDLFLV